MLRQRLEQHTDPKVISERDSTAADMAVIEAAWQRVEALLVKKGNLTKLPNGEWGWIDIDAGRKHEVAA